MLNHNEPFVQEVTKRLPIARVANEQMAQTDRGTLRTTGAHISFAARVYLDLGKEFK